MLPPALVRAEIPLAHFARDNEFQSVRISPNGDYIALTAPAGNRTGLVVMRLSDRKITVATTFGQNQHVDRLWWVGPERLAFSVIAKDLEIEVFYDQGMMGAVNADGTGLIQFPGPLQMVDPLPDDPARAVVAEEPNWYFKADGAPLAQFRLLNVLDGTLSRERPAPARGAAAFLADRTGHVCFAIIHDKNLVPHAYWRGADKYDDWQRIELPPIADPTRQVRPLRLAPDATRAYIRSWGADGRLCLARLDLEAGRQTALACDPSADLDDVVFSSDGSEPLAAVFASGRPEIRWLESSHAEQSSLRDAMQALGGGRHVVPVSATSDGSRLILHAYSDRNPGQYFMLDRRTNKASLLVSQREWIDPGAMSEVRAVTFEARDGYRLHGYLTLPRGRPASKLPLIVNPHGGPFWVRDRWNWDADAQMLASRGYAVLQVNFRGSGGYGRSHIEAGKQGWGTVMIDDITDGLRWATAQGFADPSRACIYGASYGGYAALTSAIRYPELYRCVIDYVGVYDLASFNWLAFAAGTGAFSRFIDEYVGRSGNLLKAQSPKTHIGELRAPVLIVHGGADERVPIKHAQALRADLEKRKHPYEWLVKDSEAHGFFNAQNRIELYEKMLAFLDKHIGTGIDTAAPGTPPAP